MGVEHGVAQPHPGQLGVQPFEVGTFRQPDATGFLAQQAFVFPHRRAQLALHRLGRIPQQGQVAVAGAAGEQIEHPSFEEAAEALEGLTAQGFEPPQLLLEVLIQVLSRRLLLRPCAVQQAAAPGQPTGKPLQQQRIGEQRQQGGRQAHREPWRQPGCAPATVQGTEQGQIAFDQGLEEPVFLKRIGPTTADIGQVAVQHQSQGARGHAGPSTAESYGPPGRALYSWQTQACGGAVTADEPWPRIQDGCKSLTPPCGMVNSRRGRA